MSYDIEIKELLQNFWAGNQDLWFVNYSGAEQRLQKESVHHLFVSKEEKNLFGINCKF